MKKVLKKYFIPHKENNFHPHILHAKRAVLYSLVFLLMKVILVAFVILLPTGVFVLPDVLAEEQRQIVALTNIARREKGLPALVVSSKLDLSSQNKANDMAEKSYFAHAREEKSLSSWLKGANYKYLVAGENLAVGFSSAEEIVKAWKNSPTHYANLIDPEFKDLGVGLSGGIYNGRATVFVAQHLGAQVAAVKTGAQPAKKVIAKKSSSVEIKAEIPPPVVEVAKVSSSVLAGKIEDAQEVAPPVMSANQQTPIDRYMQAKRVLLPITSIFAVSQNIYLSAIFFFSFILLLNIVIVVAAGKKRHHVIAQTSGLIALLFIFWKF
ncbi:MAG: hypothetical protein A2563_03575 [Candidatus Magasanikbacteria bacterium RIFOXYD1_FULL_40_23]|uniref:SCP domain-containing protein n=1 Tax=Candidatus Magasanikbacteria bacterium RIFOXYD1_FULL_40_23 TaxID=1798705 RepID=A0A1F6P9W0_9BACT|nr:MAG: hypothetical protein A2563_03575 [Candidatus Magasanikbacteria bacterium RIFOXYD1_FULL_40_23]